LFEIEIADAYAKKKIKKFNTYNFISEFTLDQLDAELKKAIVNVLSKTQKTSALTNDPALKEKA
jgi:rRNA-processing protein FCF1